MPEISDHERELLPANVKPSHYKLTFEPDLVGGETFDGIAIIDLDVLEDTSRITLNAADLEILKVEVISSGADLGLWQVDVLALETEAKTQRVTFILKDKLDAGTKVELKISFSGSLLHHAHGFFRSRYQGEDGKPKWMVSTSLQPTDARKVWPCFDEPALKTTYEVSLIGDSDLFFVGNMPIASDTSIQRLGKSKRVVTFGITPVMASYIVSFALGHLNSIETHSFRIPIRLIAPRDMDIRSGRYALELAARSLAVLEKIFDIDFPLPKVDLIAVLGGQGAMENWGLVTFDASYLMIDPAESTASLVRLISGVVVHELAHQWFGNLVTMEFWDGLWLNEGFAEWAKYLAWETLDPDMQYWKDFAAGEYQQALALDANHASHPVEVPIQKASDIDQIFDDISYKKGCAVIRMASSFLGVDVFVKGVQKYLKKHAYGNTVTSDLWDALSEVSGKDVGKIMDIWTRNTGYPVVDVTENAEKGTITVEQHRFFLDGKLSPDEDEVLYPLSLGLLSENGPEEAILYGRSGEIKVSLDFYKLNAGHGGFFRVSYPSSRLRTLGQNITAGLLSVEDRIGILSDALAMATSGHGQTRTSDVLDLLRVFEDEDNVFVWKQIWATLDAIRSAWMFEDQEALNAFKTKLSRKLLMKKGWKFHKGESSLDQVFKASLFVQGRNDVVVQKAARHMFEAFFGGDDKTINVNIQEAVFSTVLQHGGVTEYEAVLAAAEKAPSLSKRSICLTALGAAEDATLIARTLELAISPDIVIRNDTFKLVTALKTHAQGIKATWAWLQANFDQLIGIFPATLGAFSRLLDVCISALATTEQVEEVREFFASKDTASYDKLLAQSLDAMQSKASWVARDGEDVKRWFADHGYAVTRRS